MARKDLIEIVIAEMGKDDLPEVVAIETASFSKPWSEPLFYNEIQNPRSISMVARFGRKIVGYICASQIIDEGHILTLAVHPEFRRLGIGSMMVREMINSLRSRNCRSLFLEVRVSNEGARKMYEQAGFQVLGIRKEYFASPDEDGVVMVLNLNESAS